MVSAWFSGLMPAACGRAAGGQSGLLVDTVGDERSRTDRDLSSASAAPMSKFGASGSVEPAAATAAPSSWPLLWWTSTSMHITHHPSSVTRILLAERKNSSIYCAELALAARSGRRGFVATAGRLLPWLPAERACASSFWRAAEPQTVGSWLLRTGPHATGLWLQLSHRPYCTVHRYQVPWYGTVRPQSTFHCCQRT
jgi:hypothetical protein